MTATEPRFSSFRATMICEGVEDPPGDTQEEQEEAYIAAWQQLIDSGACWTLQGWFGRQAMHMIEQGHCRCAPGA